MGAIKVPTDTMSWEGKESDEKLGIWAAFPGRLRDVRIPVCSIDKCSEKKIVCMGRKAGRSFIMGVWNLVQLQSGFFCTYWKRLVHQRMSLCALFVLFFVTDVNVILLKYIMVPVGSTFIYFNTS